MWDSEKKVVEDTENLNLSSKNHNLLVLFGEGTQ